jgi:hypothetical protein
MSTLEVSNLNDGTTTVATTYVTNGSAKAWVNFNGTGTIAARDSFNVASLTDSSTGNYVVNFSNSFGNGNFSAVATQGNNDGSNPGQNGVITVGQTVASSSSIETSNTSATNNDWAQISHISHGDLA